MKKARQSAGGRLPFLLVLILVAASFSFAMFQGGFVSWFLFGSFLPVAVYSILLKFYPVKTIMIKRHFQKIAYEAGEHIPVTIRFVRSNRFPLFYVLLEDETACPVRGNPSKIVLFPYFKTRLEYKYTIEKAKRGEYQFTGFRVVIADFLGIVRKEFYIGIRDKIVVFPSYINIAFEPYSNRLDNGTAASENKVLHDATMAISVRKYQPGDRFSWIDWKQTARKSDIMTKEFEERLTNDMLIVLDRTPDVDFELSVSFTASIIRRMIQRGNQVGLYSFGKTKAYFPVRGGNHQLLSLYYHLAVVRDDLTGCFGKMLNAENIFQKQKQTVIFVINQLRKEVALNIGAFGGARRPSFVYIVKGTNRLISPEESEMIHLLQLKGIMTKVVFGECFTDG